jgi:hypothetical protein
VGGIGRGHAQCRPRLCPPRDVFSAGGPGGFQSLLTARMMHAVMPIVLAMMVCPIMFSVMPAPGLLMRRLGMRRRGMRLGMLLRLLR